MVDGVLERWVVGCAPQGLSRRESISTAWSSAWPCVSPPPGGAASARQVARTGHLACRRRALSHRGIAWPLYHSAVLPRLRRRGPCIHDRMCRRAAAAARVPPPARRAPCGSNRRRGRPSAPF
eukprot:scaffold1428_cov64-Phaeocystis_antarctica.AAC.6